MHGRSKEKRQSWMRKMQGGEKLNRGSVSPIDSVSLADLSPLPGHGMPRGERGFTDRPFPPST